jgi:hypothetical protein
LQPKVSASSFQYIEGLARGKPPRPKDPFFFETEIALAPGQLEGVEPIGR